MWINFNMREVLMHFWLFEKKYERSFNEAKWNKYRSYNHTWMIEILKLVSGHTTT